MTRERRSVAVSKRSTGDFTRLTRDIEPLAVTKDLLETTLARKVWYARQRWIRAVKAQTRRDEEAAEQVKQAEENVMDVSRKPSSRRKASPRLKPLF
jgi:hypothetical protein